MKHILFYMMVALYALASGQVSTQAAENEDNQVTKNPASILCRVIDTTRNHGKIRLEGEVFYNDQKEKEFSMVLDKITEQVPNPRQSIDLPFGDIINITLILTNFHQNPSDEADKRETIMTCLCFDTNPPPSFSLSEVTFTINHSKMDGTRITATPVYVKSSSKVEGKS